ncbi:MAG: hypothetical protein AAFQ36_05300 [Pseudomonadota bacterium]
MIVIIAAPAFLLPGASRTGQEISLIMGALVAVFTLFEYASTQPGLIDFRFAPPYNRFRFFTFSVVVIGLLFLCRATEGVDPFAGALLAFADQLVALLSFQFSPLTLAIALVASGGDEAFVALVSRAGAMSLILSGMGLVFFTVFIWLLRWPAERESFNLWVNLPTFDPTVGKDVSWRLRRGGLINVMVGMALPYATLAIVSRSGGWFDPAALANYQSLIWGCVLWAFLPVVIFIRGMAMLKIAWLIDRARTD